MTTILRHGVSRIGYEVRAYFRQGDSVFFTFLFPLVMLMIFSVVFSSSTFGPKRSSIAGSPRRNRRSRLHRRRQWPRATSSGR